MSNPVNVVKPVLTRTLQKLASHAIFRPRGKAIRSNSVLNLKQYGKSRSCKK